MSPEDSSETLRALEDAEYQEAVRKLLPSPDFRRFLVRWLAEAREFTLAPVAPEGIPAYNWSAGRADLMQQFMAGIQEMAPEAAEMIEREVREYGRRRSNVQADDDSDWHD